MDGRLVKIIENKKNSNMKEERLKHLNKFRVQFLTDMGCTVTDIDLEKGICEMEFNMDKRYCHSIDIIQGGFVTAMLDAVTTHAVFAMQKNIRALSTLEVKVSFYEASRAGKFKAIGRIDRMGRSIAFLSGDLFNDAGQRTASITTTAKMSFQKD